MSREDPQLADGAGVACCEAPMQRAFDLCFASVTLILLAPVMLLIALFIWVHSGRPIYFSQLRLGRRGQLFYLYKFRKFYADCDVNGTPLTLRDDHRLTAIGRILALTKADELPQFWNVIKGEMSIVGPRPESLVFADCFRNGFERVLDCRPGLFGPSQALFRHEDQFFPTNADPVEFYRAFLFPAKAKIDIDYFSRRSLFGDIGWIIRCLLAVIGLNSSVRLGGGELGFTQAIAPQKLDGVGS
jgi:lipopolysaccharide/colanic/teichoic acid biosynthesis glycosyltransferase